MTDAQCCAEIAKAHSRTFSLAASLLPREKRRGVFALYAFCRQADDIVDTVPAPGTDVEALLGAHRASLYETYAGRPNGPVFRELAWTLDRFRVPHEPFDALLSGISGDQSPARYETWDDLRLYCANVASSVGELCTFVFGVEGAEATTEAALHHARVLGVAMQLTNVLRDVGEDAKSGRCYLPEQDLLRFGLEREEVLTNTHIATDARWRELMRFEVARARALYAEAEPGIGYLARDSRSCAAACARGYAAILRAIERQAYDTIRVRAVVPSWRKATVLWRAWRLRPV